MNFRHSPIAAGGYRAAAHRSVLPRMTIRKKAIFTTSVRNAAASP
jgi:hypothetical protein